MGQIIINYLYIFIVPFLVGAAARFLFRRIKRAYRVTLVSMALAAIGWFIFYAVPSNGSELYGIIALQLTSVAAGALLAGLILRLKSAKGS